MSEMHSRKGMNGNRAKEGVIETPPPPQKEELAEPENARDSCFAQTKSSTSGSQAAITATEYATLQDAYDYFNAALFGGSLPQVLITLQRHGRARGYFSAKRFRRRDTVLERIHEVALNPDSFGGRTDEEILSTLVHELVHVWQQEHGRPGRGRYHNREWARKMHSVGLMPSATGEPGGAATGDAVSHYILEDGAFHAACRKFLKKYRLTWESAEASDDSGLVGPAARSAKTQTRTKFTCPNCGLNVWAKPGALLDCHPCSKEAAEPVLLRAEVLAETRQRVGPGESRHLHMTQSGGQHL